MTVFSGIPGGNPRNGRLPIFFFMNLNLSNKTFLISGSSKGIGLKIAETLLSEGANVIITGRSKNLIKNQFNKLYSKFRLKVAYTNGDIKSNLVLKKIKTIL